MPARTRWQVSRSMACASRNSPKPRLGARTLAANGRVDGEVSGGVRRAAQSTHAQHPGSGSRPASSLPLRFGLDQKRHSGRRLAVGCVFARSRRVSVPRSKSNARRGYDAGLQGIVQGILTAGLQSDGSGTFFGAGGGGRGWDGGASRKSGSNGGGLPGMNRLAAGASAQAGNPTLAIA
jgi:hypothetical protein